MCRYVSLINIDPSGMSFLDEPMPSVIASQPFTTTNETIHTYQLLQRSRNYKTGVINDPLGQLHSLISNEDLFFEK